jgi:hypothetical protein
MWTALMSTIKHILSFNKWDCQMISGIYPATTGNTMLRRVRGRNQRARDPSGRTNELSPFSSLKNLEAACNECIAYCLEMSYI